MLDLLYLACLSCWLHRFCIGSASLLHHFHECKTLIFKKQIITQKTYQDFMTKVSAMRNSTVIDAFTTRLLAVFIDLVKREALETKKEFADVIDMQQSNFNLMERHTRNYPKDENKRALATANLLDVFGVNPAYMKGSEQSKMYLRTPQKKERAMIKDAVEFNFNHKNEKRKLIDERDHYKKLYEETLAELNKLKGKKGA
jgi:hypothetical protein